MTDVVTIIGLCILDDKFRGEFIAAPVPTAVNYGFIIMNDEAAQLEHFAKWMVEKPMPECFRLISESIDPTLAGRPCCPEPPCPRFAVNTEQFKNLKKNTAAAAKRH